MKKQMYALLDHTAQVFLNPISFINDADAIRWFGTVVNNTEEKTNISNHPEQFTLFRLADYDDKLGTYEEQYQPKQLITGVQVQEEQLKSFNVKDLIAMLKYELQTDNVVNIAEQKEA
jgi:hypothetical protein